MRFGVAGPGFPCTEGARGPTTSGRLPGLFSGQASVIDPSREGPACMTDILVFFHATFGNGVFLTISIVLSALLCFLAIPYTTDMMTNAAAGLAGKYFGKKSRTLVINASTNNPEAASMLVSFGIGRVGGLANPLGSLFANIYLMYIVALLFVLAKFVVTGRIEKARALIALIKKERMLFGFHFLAALGMFAFGYVGLRIFMAGAPEVGAIAHPGFGGIVLLVLLFIGVGLFLFVEGKLKRARPELFEDISDEEHTESWLQFLLGSAGVIAACWVMNALFLAWTELYGTALSAVMGALIFMWLHWFVGALITSLPEMLVAINYYEKVTAPDLNVAVGSVSYSNFVNLCIAIIGLVLWSVLYLLGFTLAW